MIETDESLEHTGESESETQAEKEALTLPDLEKDFSGSSVGPEGELGLTAVYDIPVQISAVLGRAALQIHQLLKLGRGAVIELDRKVGSPIDVYVNNRLVARGEVMVVEEHLGITLTEIVKAEAC